MLKTVLLISVEKRLEIHDLDNDLISIIATNQQLKDEHINFFGQLLLYNSDYCHQDTLFLQRPERITPVTPFRKNIQILYSNYSEDGCFGHWICSFYNGIHIQIYDSLNRNSLHRDHKIFLQRLYPFCEVSDETVRFIKVQKQPNAVDCGIFAIAFSVSLLFRDKPELINYDILSMRKHLIKIFTEKKIIRFPSISNLNPQVDLSLDQICKKEHAAYKMRISRMKHSPVCTNINKLTFNKKKDISQQIVISASCEKGKVSEDLLLKQSSPDVNEDVLRTKSDLSNRLRTLKENHIETDILTDKVFTSKKRLQEIQFSTINKKFKKNNELNQISVKNVVNQLTNQDVNLDKTPGKNNDYKTIVSSAMPKQKIDIKKSIKKKNKELLKEERKLQNIPLKIDNVHIINQLIEMINKTDHTISAESKIEAENIMKWCLEKRKEYIKKLNHLSMNLTKIADKCLTAAQNNPKSDSLKNLCGKSRHTPSTESYFSEMIYSFSGIKNNIITMNAQGQATDILPIVLNKKKNIVWHCNSYCYISQNREILIIYERFLESLAAQTLRTFPKFFKECFVDHGSYKLGHLADCYMHQTLDQSLFFAVELLSSHFPTVRNIKRLLYKIRQTFEELYNLDNALKSGCLETLRITADNMKATGVEFVSNEYCMNQLNEDRIREEFKSAFITLYKRSMDMAEHVCISCRKLHFKKFVMKIETLRKKINSIFWDHLITYINDNKIYSTEYTGCPITVGLPIKG